jgi:Gas vesicle synthesis protein GvpO
MAERRTVRRAQDEDEPAQDNGERVSDDEDTTSGSRGPSRRRDAGLTAAEAAQRGLRQIAELTGKETEGVTGVEPAEDGWIVGVEVVEDRRVPSSADLLATYQTELDISGEMLSYRRVRRYPRGRGDNGEGT